jgi:hypothetical protein
MKAEIPANLSPMRIFTTPNGIGNKAHDIWPTKYRTEAN